MSLKKEITQLPAAEIDKLRAEIEQLRAEIQALKFSESVQKTRADELEARTKALEAENQEANQKIESFVPIQAQHYIRRFTTSWFSTSFSVLKLSQEILDKIFPGDRTVHATMSGITIRKMFEVLMHHLLPTNFFDSGDSIDIKLHTDINQFMEFAKAFARFIYAANMELPGGDFVVCGINEPRKVQRVLSNCGHRIYEFVKFVVSFSCRNTKKIYKIVFSCDAGHSFPQEDFDVDSLTFDVIRGFDACVNGSQIPVLQIIMGIMNRRAQWNRLPNAHFSGFLRVMNLRKTKMYVLHGCPSVSKTKFCPFSQDASKYALEFSGCRCGIDRSVSIGMLCGFLKSNLNSPLLCPFCKEGLQTLTHEPDFDPVSCIENANVLQQVELQRLQEDGRSFPRNFGLDVGASPPSELDEIRGKLSDLAKVRRPWSVLPDLPELPKDDADLFFPVNPDEDSDPEPESDSDDDQDDQDDLEEDDQVIPLSPVQPDSHDYEPEDDSQLCPRFRQDQVIPDPSVQPDLYDPEDDDQFCPRFRQDQAIPLSPVQPDYTGYDREYPNESDYDSDYESGNSSVNGDEAEYPVQPNRQIDPEIDPDDYTSD